MRVLKVKKVQPHYRHALLVRSRTTVNVMVSRKVFSRLNLGAMGACPCPVISAVLLELLMRLRAFNTIQLKRALIVMTLPRVKHMARLDRVSLFALFSSLPEVNVFANLV